MEIIYCPNCGCKLNKGDKFCTKCGSKFPSGEIQLKVPAVSLILSAFYPGLGQMYNGDKLSKGLLIFFGFAIGSLFFFIPGVLVWIFGMYDAYKKTGRIQKGEAEYSPTKKKDIALIIFIPLIVLILILGITIYAVYFYYGSPETLLNKIEYYSQYLKSKI
ncbi:zinc-ribbon domain-containing protein [Methanolacinia petrolearia]|uniref:zinc-ribbon domain-containing protein n=1 Tax=Methanolacinia petrolearia TaxID=54120 RepID=UPI003BAAFF41